MTTIPRCPFCGGEASIIADDIGPEIAACFECDVVVKTEIWQRRVTPKLGWICSSCGDMQEADCDSIDNGTDFQCRECGKHSVVNLFRENEYSMICQAIHRVKTGGMTIDT